MSDNYKKVCRGLNYFEYFPIFVSAVSGCVSISTFPSLVGVPVGITSFAVGLKICAIVAGIKHKLIINEKKKRHDRIVLVGKTKLNTIKVLIFRALIDSYINHDEFVSVNNVLREYNEEKEEIKNPETSPEYMIYG